MSFPLPALHADHFHAVLQYRNHGIYSWAYLIFLGGGGQFTFAPALCCKLMYLFNGPSEKYAKVICNCNIITFFPKVK